MPVVIGLWIVAPMFDAQGKPRSWMGIIVMIGGFILVAGALGKWGAKQIDWANKSSQSTK
jgi:hypothetical protein